MSQHEHTKDIEQRHDDEYGCIMRYACACGARRRVIYDSDGRIMDDSRWIAPSSGVLYERAGKV
jgi:hypothetical protein